MGNWRSIEQAEKAHQEAMGRALYYRDRARDWAKLMLAGPRIEGSLVIVPANWYDEEANGIWRDQRFWFDASTTTWRKDCSKPAQNGKVYSPKQWLKSVEREYQRIFGESLERARAKQKQDEQEED